MAENAPQPHVQTLDDAPDLLKRNKMDFIPCIESMTAILKQKQDEEGEEAEVSLSAIIEAELLSRICKKEMTILVVGTSGTGKSSLINTLAHDYLCEVGRSIGPVTKDLEMFPVEFGKGDSTRTLKIWDSTGFIGDEAMDSIIAENIEERVGIPDLTIICFDITAFAGRDLPPLQARVIAGLKKIRGKLFERCAIALTKVNRLANEYQEEAELNGEDDPWHTQLEKAVEERKASLRSSLKDELSDETYAYAWASIPICIFGRVSFKKRRGDYEAHEATPIGEWKQDWWEDSWNQVLSVADQNLVTMFLILCTRFHSKPGAAVVREAAPKQKLLDMLSARTVDAASATVGVLVAIGLGVGLAPVTAGLSIPVGVGVGGVIAYLGGIGVVASVHSDIVTSRKAKEAKEAIERQYQNFLQQMQRQSASALSGKCLLKDAIEFLETLQVDLGRFCGVQQEDQEGAEPAGAAGDVEPANAVIVEEPAPDAGQVQPAPAAGAVALAAVVPHAALADVAQDEAAVDAAAANAMRDAALADAAQDEAAADGARDAALADAVQDAAAADAARDAAMMLEEAAGGAALIADEAGDVALEGAGEDAAPTDAAEETEHAEGGMLNQWHFLRRGGFTRDVLLVFAFLLLPISWWLATLLA